MIVPRFQCHDQSERMTMQEPGHRPVAKMGVIGICFLVGQAVAGPIGAQVSAVAGEMLAGSVERNWDRLHISSWAIPA